MMSLEEIVSIKFLPNISAYKRLSIENDSRISQSQRGKLITKARKDENTKKR